MVRNRNKIPSSPTTPFSQVQLHSFLYSPPLQVPQEDGDVELQTVCNSSFLLLLLLRLLLLLQQESFQGLQSCRINFLQCGLQILQKTPTPSGVRPSMGCNVDTGSTTASSTDCRAISAADLKCLLSLLLWSCCSQGYFSRCVFLTPVQCFALIPEAKPASLMGLAASCSKSISEIPLFGIGPLQPSCYQNYCGHPIYWHKTFVLQMLERSIKLDI